MLREVPPHRLLLFFVVGIVLGSVAWHVKWANIPRIVAVFSRQFPQSSAPAENPPGETAEARRERLKDEALASGRRVLARPCDEATRTPYKDALIQLARQRMRDMGCMVDFACNVENGFKEVSLNFYSTEKDRRISQQMRDAMAAGGLPVGALGIYTFFVGHPQELEKLGGGAFVPASDACADVLQNLPARRR